MTGPEQLELALNTEEFSRMVYSPAVCAVAKQLAKYVKITFYHQLRDHCLQMKKTFFFGFKGIQKTLVG